MSAIRIQAFGLAFAVLLGALVGVGVARCTAAAPPPACDHTRLLAELAARDAAVWECHGANLSMAGALDTLAAREAGCEAFVRLPVTDPWIKYRLEHPRKASGIPSPASSRPSGSESVPGAGARSGKPL